MNVDGFTRLEGVSGIWPYGIALAVTLGAVALAWLLIRYLSDRWRRQAGDLTARLSAAVAQSEERLNGLEREACQYSPDLPPPYRDRVRSLCDLLQTIHARLTAIHHQLIEIPVPPMSAPVSTSAHVSYLVWFEPRARYRRRTRLRAAESALAELDDRFAAADDLLRMLRRTPLETAELARDLHTQLDTAFELLEALQASELHGESLDRVAHSLTMDAQNLASLPDYLLDAKESHILRRARPDAVSHVWQALARLKPDIHANLTLVKRWQSELDQLREDLVAMRQAVSNAHDRLMEANSQLDLTELHEAWQEAQVIAEEAERRFRQPTPEDLPDLAQVRAIIKQADLVVDKLAVAEALRLSVNAKLAVAASRLEEAERQLRQLSEAPRYPLDRVPFQTELDRLRRQLAVLTAAGEARSPQQLESALAALQVLDRQGQTLAEHVTQARGDRRRLVALLDELSPETASPEDAEPTDWLTWAQDLQAEVKTYAAECWTGAGDVRLATLLADAEALDIRRRRWIPAHVADLLVPDTLPRQVREVAAIQKEIESIQNRLDQGTRWLQRLRQTEETARTQLQAVYAALDRLEIVAADLLPAELAEEDNHWAHVREHLDAGYGLDLTLQSRGIGSLWEKADRVTDWVETCAATLSGWHRTLVSETRSAMGTLQTDLEDLATLAPLNHVAAVEQAHSVLVSLESLPSRGPARGEREAEPIVDRCSGLAAQVGDQLRALARLDEVTVKLEEEVFAPLAEPVDRWRSTEKKADEALGRLQLLEVQSGRRWPPISCDTAVLRPESELAKQLQQQLHRETTTVARVIEIAEQLTATYTRICALVAERESAYQAQRPKLDALLDNIDHWCDNLAAYGKQHSSDPVITSAIRARLDEIEAALTQLHIEYDQAEDLIPGEEALRVLEALWRQASRDVAVGAGMNVIPADWIARPN